MVVQFLAGKLYTLNPISIGFFLCVLVLTTLVIEFYTGMLETKWGIPNDRDTQFLLLKSAR